MSIIIDRRKNDRKKSTVNRQRFLRRYKGQLRKSLGDLIQKRTITDMDQGGEVRIPAKDISEPRFRHGAGGDREIVHAGNHSFNAGDRLPRPPGGQGAAGPGTGEGDAGDSTDEFIFTLSRDEFMELFFDDLELPHLARLALGEICEPKLQRAGYTPSGTPANLAVARSMRNSIARRIALGGPLRREIKQLQAEQADPQRIAELQARLRRLPYLEDIDLRYRHRVQVPQPLSRAVMFCLMDVSASMSEHKKDLSKRFYTLLYLFLRQKYRQVDLVFIRHTSDAEEVDEVTFFHDPKTGGTVVISALKLMHEIITERYPPDSWNIYGAQCSDGDAFGADPEKSRNLLSKVLLPALRYFAYIEVPDDQEELTPLSSAYSQIVSDHFAMKQVHTRQDVYPVLRELFQREAA